MSRWKHHISKLPKKHPFSAALLLYHATWYAIESRHPYTESILVYILTLHYIPRFISASLLINITFSDLSPKASQTLIDSCSLHPIPSSSRNPWFQPPVKTSNPSSAGSSVRTEGDPAHTHTRWVSVSLYTLEGHLKVTLIGRLKGQAKGDLKNFQRAY